MKKVEITIDGEKAEAQHGATVASALLTAGITRFRRSVDGEPRTPMCGMGICFECRVTIDGIKHVKSCQAIVRNLMNIETDGNN